MDITMKLVYFMIDLLVPLMIGYTLQHNPYFSVSFFNKMINYNIFLISPVLSMLSFWVLPLTWNLIWLPIFGAILCFLPGLFAYFISKNKYESPLDTGSYLLAAMLSNLGTLGGLCAFILYGEAGFAYTQLVVLMQIVVIFLFCYPMSQYYYAQQQGEEKQTVSIRSLLFSVNQLPILGLLLGLALYGLDIPRPKLLGELVSPLVHIAAWTALIPVGHVMDFSAIRHYYRSTFDLVPIKFVLTPVFSYMIAKVVFTDSMIVNTILILACTPTAINAVITAKIHDLNVHIATASFVATTVLFLLIVYPSLLFFLTES